MSEAQRFRKKPVVVEAIQWTGANEEDVYCFIADSKGWTMEQGRLLLIHTLEGDMEARHGDWIIRGVKGEFYPCKPDIFAATYEPADATPAPAPTAPAQPAQDEGAVTADLMRKLAWDATGLQDPYSDGKPRGTWTLGMDDLLRIGQYVWARAERAYGGEVAALRGALELAAVRLEILTGRMRACHHETGKHELLDEADSFCREAREATRLTPPAAAAAVTALVEAADAVLKMDEQDDRPVPGWMCEVGGPWDRLHNSLAPFLTARGGDAR